MWKINEGVPLDYYFNPVSYIIATKWLNKKNRVERDKLVDKCIELSERHQEFSQVTTLILFRDALMGKIENINLITSVITGAKLLFENKDISYVQ